MLVPTHKENSINMLEYLPIKEIAVPEDQHYYIMEPTYPLQIGRCCLGAFDKPQTPVLFAVPLDGTIMKFDQWITNKDLDKSFLGVDRTLDPARLAGINYAVQNLQDALTLMNREGALPDLIYKTEIGYNCIELDTWAWIVRGGRIAALVCQSPGFNGRFTLA